MRSRRVPVQRDSELLRERDDPFVRRLRVRLWRSLPVRLDDRVCID